MIMSSSHILIIMFVISKRNPLKKLVKTLVLVLSDAMLPLANMGVKVLSPNLSFLFLFWQKKKSLTLDS